jgi:hypothetical protein
LQTPNRAVLILGKMIFSKKEYAFGEKPKVCQIVLQPKTAAKVKFPDKRADFEIFFRAFKRK